MLGYQNGLPWYELFAPLGKADKTYTIEEAKNYLIECFRIFTPDMAEMMKVPVLGIVENYSYVACPDCGRQIKVFGESHIDEIAASLNLKVLGKMPIDPAYAAKADAGAFDEIDNPYVEATDEVMPQ